MSRTIDQRSFKGVNNDEIVKRIRVIDEEMGESRKLLRAIETFLDSAANKNSRGTFIRGIHDCVKKQDSLYAERRVLMEEYLRRLADHTDHPQQRTDAECVLTTEHPSQKPGHPEDEKDTVTAGPSPGNLRRRAPCHETVRDTLPDPSPRT